MSILFYLVCAWMLFDAFPTACRKNRARIARQKAMQKRREEQVVLYTMEDPLRRKTGQRNANDIRNIRA